MKKVIVLFLLLAIPGIGMADNHSEAVVELFICELKEGAKMVDL